MYILATIAVLPLVAQFVSCESTKEPPKDVQQKTTLKPPVNEAPTSAEANTINLASLWANQPTSQHVNLQQHGWGDKNERYKMLLRSPHSLTKLAKTLSLGFDPSFSKDYFEPFERRPRPVLLVAFRKNGLANRHVIKYTDGKSSEIAELQSPFNQVSNFWQHDGDA